MSDEPQHGQPSVGPVGVKRLITALGIACAIAVLAGFGIEKHAHYDWETWPAAYAVYGFLSYVFLIALAKQWRKVVMRDEEYYDRD